MNISFVCRPMTQFMIRQMTLYRIHDTSNVILQNSQFVDCIKSLSTNHDFGKKTHR